MNGPLHPHRTLHVGGRQEDNEAKRMMKIVCEALREKGYNPVAQISGYLSAYITNHNNARNLIRSLERDELIEELVRAYARDYV